MQCLHYAEPWAQVRCLASPVKLINLGSTMDSGSTSCICQVIKYVYGRKCNYTIFRHAARATSCTNFLIMPYYFVIISYY